MAEQQRRIVTIGVSSIDEVKSRVSRASRGQPPGSRISFISIDVLWRVLGPKRWEILQAMAAQGPLSVREVARRVERDVKAVHGDVKALRLAGVVRKTDDGKVMFPYDEIHVDFRLLAQSAA